MKISEIFKGKYLIAVIMIAVVAVASFLIYEKEHPKEKYVKASGTVEVTQVQLAPLAGGRILELAVKESDHVKKGQFIAKMSLDGADDEVKMAEGALATARAQLDELLNGFRKEDIAKAESEVAMRQAQYNQSKRDAERFSKLAAEGVVATRDAELYAEASKTTANALKMAGDQLKLLKNGFRPEQIAAARANVARLESQVQKARTLVGYKTFYAPEDGVVLTKNYETGDVITAGAPIATIGDMGDCWVKLYIPSTQLGRVKLGQKCDVFVDPFKDKKFSATVTEVNQQAEYNPRMSLTQDQRANMVFWIKVSIENPEGIIKPGMPADVTLL